MMFVSDGPMTNNIALVICSNKNFFFFLQILSFVYFYYYYFLSNFFFHSIFSFRSVNGLKYLLLKYFYLKAIAVPPESCKPRKVAIGKGC